MDAKPIVKTYAFAALGYSQVFGVAPTLSQLQQEVGRLPQIALIRFMSGVAALYANGAANDPKFQSDLVRELGGAQEWVMNAASFLESGEWALFNEEIFAGIAKLAFRFSPRDDRPVPDNFGASLLRVSLMYSELLSQESLPATKKATSEDILYAELRSLARNGDHPFSIVGRYSKFIEWLGTQRAIDRGWKHSIENDFSEFFGISIAEYFACAAFFGLRYTMLKDVAALQAFDSIVDVPAWLQYIDNPAYVGRFLELFAIRSEELIEHWTSDALSSLSMGALGDLWRRPLVALDRDHIVAPLPSLIYNLMGEGFFYNVLDRYPKSQKGELSQAFGYFLQAYVRELLDHAYANSVNCAVLGDDDYGKGGGKQTSDSVIFEGDNVIFVEVVARRVNLEAVIRDLDDVAIAKVMKDGVEQKLKGTSIIRSERLNDFR